MLGSKPFLVTQIARTGLGTSGEFAELYSARFQASTVHSDTANWPGDEATGFPITARLASIIPKTLEKIEADDYMVDLCLLTLIRLAWASISRLLSSFLSGSTFVSMSA